MKKHWKPYALHILDSIEKVHLIVKRGDIIKDTVLYDAVLRNMQTMSEATRHLPDEKTGKFPHIPWKDISGFRNILVHDYLGDIDPLTILNVINNHLNPLKNSVEEMLKNEEVE